MANLREKMKNYPFQLSGGQQLIDYMIRQSLAISASQAENNVHKTKHVSPKNVKTIAHTVRATPSLSCPKRRNYRGSKNP